MLHIFTIELRFINARRRIVQPMIDSSNRASKYIFFYNLIFLLLCRYHFRYSINHNSWSMKGQNFRNAIIIFNLVTSSMAYQHHPAHPDMPGFFPNSMDPRLPGLFKFSFDHTIWTISNGSYAVYGMQYYC